jgi:hypothetical protein
MSSSLVAPCGNISGDSAFSISANEVRSRRYDVIRYANKNIPKTISKDTQNDNVGLYRQRSALSDLESSLVDL